MKQNWWRVLHLMALVPALVFIAACESDKKNDESATTVDLVAPTLLTPANNATFNHFPRTTTLAWSAVEGADKYVVDVDYMSSSWDAWKDEEVSGTTYTFGFVGAQEGRWRVRAKTDGGTEGPWSAWREFKYTI